MPERNRSSRTPPSEREADNPAESESSRTWRDFSRSSAHQDVQMYLNRKVAGRLRSTRRRRRNDDRAAQRCKVACRLRRTWRRRRNDDRAAQRCEVACRLRRTWRRGRNNDRAQRCEVACGLRRTWRRRRNNDRAQRCEVAGGLRCTWRWRRNDDWAAQCGKMGRGRRESSNRAGNGDARRDNHYCNHKANAEHQLARGHDSYSSGWGTMYRKSNPKDVAGLQQKS